MLIVEKSQTTNDVLEAKRRRAEGEHVPAAAERDRLQMLVSELLSENQKLRFENEGLRTKAAVADQRAQSAEHGLKHATRWAGIVL
jgi:regulator of replication initiation timing